MFRMCKKCGGTMTSDAAFCGHCGSPVGSIEAQRFLKVIEAHNGTISLLSDRIVISRKGMNAFFSHGFKGDKEIYLSSVTSIQFRKPGTFTSGYIQFGVLGGVESRGGLLDATKDENTVVFVKTQLADFERLKSDIETAIRESKASASGAPSAQSVSSMADELNKLAVLKGRGLLTEEEFQSAKKRLLD